MKLKCLTCEALTRMVYLCAAYSPHQIDVELNRIGLHNQPADLRSRLQGQIDEASKGDYDAILLAYGLCGKATAGLRARNVPLVIPRAHDCITLFLGSRAEYKDQFENKPGTYWYVQDYIERRESMGTTLSLGAGEEDGMKGTYEEYVEKFGQDNADYLMEVMGAWQSHYQRAVYIDMGVGDGSQVEAETKDEAARRGWNFERREGDVVLIRRLLEGDWAEDFLIVEPGSEITMSYDENVITLS